MDRVNRNLSMAQFGAKIGAAVSGAAAGLRGKTQQTPKQMSITPDSVLREQAPLQSYTRNVILP